MTRCRVCALVGPGATTGENTHVAAGLSDWTLSIDELTALCPNLEHVALVVAWFGDDLRCGHCAIGPRVEGRDRAVQGDAVERRRGWIARDVPVVSSHGGGPAYGGTPSDGAVRAAIADLKARGIAVTLYPIVMMDVPADNGLPTPIGGAMQPAYPWRGRITCDPAPGRPGSPDRTGAVAAQVVGVRRRWISGQMAPHYAGLAQEAGGVDAIADRLGNGGDDDAARRGQQLSVCRGAGGAGGGCAGDRRGGDEDHLCGRLERIFGLSAAMGREVLPSRSALGVGAISMRSGSTITCRWPIGAMGWTMPTGRWRRRGMNSII